MPELQEGRYAGEFMVSEGNGRISREIITVLSGETLQAATVLGKVTASGKYKALDPAAIDGSAALGARTLAHGADAYLQLQMGSSLDIIKPLVARNPRRG
jgi:hypothetical protein